MTDLVVSDLTQSTLEGTGVFDVLMRSTKTHLEAEFSKNRIKGAEYATVYLGSLDSVMRTSMEFLLQKQRIGLEAQLLEQQIILAQVGVLKANAELAIVEASLAKIPLELAQLTAQTELVNAQKANTIAELAIIQANALKVPAEIAQLTAQTAIATQQKLNLIAEGLNIPKQGQKLEADTQVAIQQTLNLGSENLAILARTNLVNEQMESEASRNFIHPTDPLSSGAVEQERRVLLGQKCKLDAEFDVLMVQKDKGASENSLLLQKVVTEAAQTTATGIAEDSVIGRQKALYAAQAEGFQRDAEQKATKILLDTWNVRKTADSDGTAVVVLDSDITAAVTRLKMGIAV